MEYIGPIIISLIVLIVVFLICRELICWYFKINKRVELMEEQNELMKKMLSGGNSQASSSKTSLEDEEDEDFEENVGWAKDLSVEEMEEAQKYVDKLEPQQVVVKVIPKDKMKVWSLKYWNSHKNDADFKLIYKKYS